MFGLTESQRRKRVRYDDIGDDYDHVSVFVGPRFITPCFQPTYGLSHKVFNIATQTRVDVSMQESHDLLTRISRYKVKNSTDKLEVGFETHLISGGTLWRIPILRADCDPLISHLWSRTPEGIRIAQTTLSFQNFLHKPCEEADLLRLSDEDISLARIDSIAEQIAVIKQFDDGVLPDAVVRHWKQLEDMLHILRIIPLDNIVIEGKIGTELAFESCDRACELAALNYGINALD
jgi:hypothetical protein